MSAKQTDAPQFISDLSGGNFAQGLGIALTEVAQGVVATGKKGKVQITLDIARIGDSNQVKIAHTLAYVEPTAKGKRSRPYFRNSNVPQHRWQHHHVCQSHQPVI